MNVFRDMSEREFLQTLRLLSDQDRAALVDETYAINRRPLPLSERRNLIARLWDSRLRQAIDEF